MKIKKNIYHILFFDFFFEIIFIIAKALKVAINETSYTFHPFIEAFELPRLVIVSKDSEHYISITKKQFQLMDKFLRDS